MKRPRVLFLVENAPVPDDRRVWNEARTPSGVIVPLASAGADELGRAGLPGSVDRHFWERFGAG